MRPTDRVLEKVFFAFIYRCDRRTEFWKKIFLHLFSSATNGQGFGRRSFFLHLFSGAIDGQSFGRRIFFCLNLFSGATDGQSFGRSFSCIYLAVRPTDRVLEEEVFFAFIWRCDRRTRFWKKKFFFAFI